LSTTQIATAPEPSRAVPLPSVTAIIATRGRPELTRALEAILDHDYEGPLDVVVVFDHCEPDRTLARDGVDDGRRVQVLVNERTPGLAGGRNTGLLAAAGDLVAFCDDDDEWRPGKLRAQVAALDALPGARAATAGIEIHYQDRRTVRIPETARMTFDGFLHDRQTEAHPSTFLFDRRFLLDEVGFVDEELPGSLAEDYDLLLRVARLGPIAVAPAPFATIHWGEASFFSRRWQMTYDALDHLLGKYPEFAEHPRALARIRGQQAFALAALGDRPAARRLVRETLGLRLTEKRAYLALLISTGLVSGEQAMKAANWFGRGI
jgi:glycosyltransferase involved in cell wall biosynthesis